MLDAACRMGSLQSQGSRIFLGCSSAPILFLGRELSREIELASALVKGVFEFAVKLLKGTVTEDADGVFRTSLLC